MTLTEKVLKAHDRQIKLSYRLAKVGYTSALGKFLRLQAYYRDGLIILKKWTDFLLIRKKHIGNRYFAVDQAIIHTDHADVKNLMQVEPQIRGNDLGIIRILAPSFLLNNPLSLGMNGTEHTGVRAIFEQILSNPAQQADAIAQLIQQFLAKAVQKNQLHVGDDLPRMMVELLHQLVFQLPLSEAEITASRAYIQALPLASIPNFISQYLLAFKTAPHIRHRQQLTEKYKQSPKWASYVATAAPYHLNEHQIANSLFDMIHIAGTAGTSALLGSVIGVLCLNQNLKNDIVAEANTIWNGTDPITAETLARATLLQNVVLETARLYPPVRFVSQLSKESGEVQIGESKCPFQRGTRLLGSIFTANRDADRYDNPDDFDPTRDYSDLLSWNGYGHERACPGRDLSIELIKIFCLYLFKHYQWSSITEVKWDLEKVTAVTPNTLVLQGFSQR
ncbi:MAG: cytochrome P450 [Leptolyngbyaceae cyanobacterium bins.302]|nr:cytochrome P450 [Leptolyngbyaceae cyanobacterium bins.302]